MGESIKILTGVGCRESACLSSDYVDGGSMLLRNAGKLLLYYTTSQRRGHDTRSDSRENLK
jgi:hypothetical protein